MPAELVIRIGLDGREADGTETQKKLISLERRREANLNGNKRPQYHIYREADLARFAATGLMSSHPSTVRPFTCSERVQILERLEERLTRNPYFHLFFLREDDPWVDDEVTLYEKKGLFMVKPGGESGGVWGGRSGTLLVGPEELLAAYKSFYLDRLVRTRCRSAAESAKILRRLISKATKHADA